MDDSMDDKIYSTEELSQMAATLERRIAAAAVVAGRGPAGLALNVAKTQVFLARGALALTLSGAAVGSG